MSSKIGIITLDGKFNYGNRLQNFATTCIIKKMGMRPITLVLNEREGAVRKAKNLVKRLIGISRPSPESLMTEKRLEAFGGFNSKIPIIEIRSLSDPILDTFDYFLVGSDQVWNPDFVDEHEAEWFFLQFAPRSKRVANAPSIGQDSLTPEQANLIAKGVVGFDRVAVREKRAAELIKDCAGIDVDVICDPTLVLAADEWRAVADGRCTPEESYVFTYLLGGVGAEAAEVLDKVTDHGRIPVVPLSDRQKSGEPDAGPAEFIDLIDHAAHVVTDSFHAAVFSSILHTPLTIVHREGVRGMFSRLEQLSQMLDIEEKVYGSAVYDLARAGEYMGIDEAIGHEREKYMGYLEGCLER